MQVMAGPCDLQLGDRHRPLQRLEPAGCGRQRVGARGEHCHLHEVALQCQLQLQAGRQRRVEGAEGERQRVERQAVAQVLHHRHGHRPAVGIAAHHALATLAMRAEAFPGVRRLIGQQVRCPRPAALEQLAVQMGDRRRRGVQMVDTLGMGQLGEGLAAQPERGRRPRQLVMQPAQRLVLVGRNAAGDQQHAGVAWRVHQLHPWVQCQRLAHRAGVHAERDEHRCRARRRQTSEQPYCHRNTPSRQA